MLPNPIPLREKPLKPSEALQSNRAAIRRVVASHRACNARVFGSVLHGQDTDGSEPQSQPTLLARLAYKYIWWKTPAQALISPMRVIAQVMNVGDYADVQAMANEVGNEVLAQVLIHAEAGQFDERSWAYWHYRLGLADVDAVPRLPSRRFA